jgi:hypothetical protein
VTAYLTSLGIPIVFDTAKIFAALDKLPTASVKALADLDLATKEDDPTDGALPVQTPPGLRRARFMVRVDGQYCRCRRPRPSSW